MIKRLCDQWHSKQPVDERYLSLIDINGVHYMVKMVLIIIIYGIIDASGS
ncbi:hypothetical protein PEC301296_30870 [Pectobacterium carotovorum subsp. carotovorum]|nr:hypothetical protein GZ59_36630 [Pectobacterium atrosepticum]POW24168.1 hypothetical protein PB72LOC_04216 [Pectobacterium atrosepticum]GKV86776.1 hypothetical protein PEC301296_30870 [Pectobacterium carotovorum subsp. carotovorum]